MIISLDTETTGIDVAHGAMPFLVTTCCNDSIIRFWEWHVNPLTREPEIPNEDIAEIIELVDAAELIYLHNSKFDIRILHKIGIVLPWEKVRDTLPASHLLESNGGHRLDQLCSQYLGIDINPYEDTVKEVTRKCRDIAKRLHSDWQIAYEGAPGMPSVKDSSNRDEDKPWKNDMWLPRALARADGRVNHAELPTGYVTACSRYANADSEWTLPLGVELERQIRERGLWNIYMHRLELVRADAEMEDHGLTAIGTYTEATHGQYSEHVAEAEDALVAIAAEYGHVLELAKGASINDNMRDFFYGAVHQHCTRCKYTKRVKHWTGEEPSTAGDGNGDGVCPKCLKRKRDPARVVLVTEERDNLALPPVFNGKTKGPSLDKDAMQQYLATTDGSAYEFIDILDDKRMYDTAVTYIDGYRRYWVPVDGAPGYYRIHASINPCGTDHLRQSCNSPNLQNVAGETKELNLRQCFGPLPGREWWRFDYKSIEARIPAYESGEPKLLEVFENPDKPPYWGSTYLLTASIFYPNKFAPHANIEGSFKKDEPRLYKRAKFFWLARQYGAGKRKGDLLAGFAGASDMMEQGLPMLTALQLKYLRDAERIGYVETLPDRSVDSKRGYPILASRTADGRVLSTTPFNYHTSGTACWIKNTALVRCNEQCRRWRSDGFDAYVALEVHDEILFDFPRGDDTWDNAWRALVLKRHMERSGDDVGIPAPVTVERHAVSWANGDGIPAEIAAEALAAAG